MKRRIPTYVLSIVDKSPPIPVALLSNKKTTPQDEVQPAKTQRDIPEPKDTPKKIAAKKQPPQRRKRSTTPDNQKTNVSHQRLLGQLEIDKKYLQNLLKHPGKCDIIVFIISVVHTTTTMYSGDIFNMYKTQIKLAQLGLIRFDTQRLTCYSSDC